MSYVRAVCVSCNPFAVCSVVPCPSEPVSRLIVFLGECSVKGYSVGRNRRICRRFCWNRFCVWLGCGLGNCGIRRNRRLCGNGGVYLPTLPVSEYFAMYFWISVASLIVITPSPLQSAAMSACSESVTILPIALWIRVASSTLILPSMLTSPIKM